MIDTATIERIEHQAAGAWPAIRLLVVGDWLVRLSDGYTRRANATSAIRPSASLLAAWPAIEAAYAAHGQPTQFRLTPLSDPACDALLVDAGYGACDLSVVMVAFGEIGGRADCVIEPEPSVRWLALSSSIARHDARQVAAHAALVSRIAQVAGFATAFDGDVAVGVGLGVVDCGMMGLFALGVAPGHRGRGHGRALVAGLRGWGASIGATTSWLQVADDNHGAIALYAAMGFTPAYRYRYRVAPGTPTVG